MGNCQAAEAATVVIQHPGGRVERAYWSLTAGNVMASNPGHYVGVIVTSPSVTNNNRENSSAPPVKYLKLLRPDDTLHIGHVYRLVTFQEVLREFGTKKRVRLSRLLVEQKDNISRERRERGAAGGGGGGRGRRDSIPENTPRMAVERRQEEEQVHGTGSGSTAVADGRRSNAGVWKNGQWRPSLQSIEEASG